MNLWYDWLQENSVDNEEDCRGQIERLLFYIVQHQYSFSANKDEANLA